MPGRTCSTCSCVRRAESSGGSQREDVEAMAYGELQRSLKARGLSAAGKKAELVDRLLDALQAESHAAQEASGAPAGAAAAGGGSESVEDAVARMSVTELREALKERGLPASGKKADMAERLIEAMAE